MPRGGAGQGGQFPGRTAVTARPLTWTSGLPGSGGTHLTGVGSLDSLSGQRLGLESPGVAVLGQALPCIQGGHANRPGGGHAHGAHARGAHQASHAGRAHAAGNAGPPGPSVLQELAAESLPGPHLGRRRRGTVQAQPPRRVPSPLPQHLLLPPTSRPGPWPRCSPLCAHPAGSPSRAPNRPTSPSRRARGRGGLTAPYWLSSWLCFS